MVVRVGWRSTIVDAHQKNGCHTLKEGNCPLSKDESVIYTFNVPISIKDSFADNEGTLELYLTDNEKRDILCFQLPVLLVKLKGNSKDFFTKI